jgi:hypothetical protein
MTKQSMSSEQRAKALLRTLSRELFQTETSAALHCRREATRLGDTSPAKALHAVADHADAVLVELPLIAERNGLPVSEAGRGVGAMFSQLRDKLFDLTIDSERSYRGTLLGCRHGLDVVRVVQHVAIQQGMTDLDGFCAAWLNTRIVLVQKLEDELAWFAHHPDVALKVGRLPLARRGSVAT